jgi:hypothetical protein
VTTSASPCRIVAAGLFIVTDGALFVTGHF